MMVEDSENLMDPNAVRVQRMRFNKGPAVISTFPTNYALSIPVDVEITVEFNMDIFKTSIAGSVHVSNRLGDKVDCRISYSERVLTITPRLPLPGENSYRVIINGDNDPMNPSSFKGITNPLGDAMLGDYIFSFTTFSDTLSTEEIINGSPNNIIITEQPVIQADITTKSDNVIISVDVEISDSNTFDDLLWSGTVSIESMKAGTKPNHIFADGSYYWRARAVGKLEGRWSETFQFGIDTRSGATIVDGDETEFDIAFPDSWGMLEANIIDVYPNDNSSNVAVNLKTISIVLDRVVSHDVLSASALTLTGTTVDEDDNSTSHGAVEHIIDIAFDHYAGTTTIVLTLPVLGAS